MSPQKFSFFPFCENKSKKIVCYKLLFSNILKWREKWMRVWENAIFKDGYFGIKFSIACISQFYFTSKFCFTISRGQNFAVLTTNSENYSTCNWIFIFQFSKSVERKTFFSIKPNDILISYIFIAFYNTTCFKISPHVLWHWYIKDKVPFRRCFLYAILSLSKNNPKISSSFSSM